MSEETGNLSQQDRVNKGTEGFQRQADHTVAVSGGSEYAILAYAYNRSPLQIWVYDGDKLLGHGADDTFLPHVLYRAAGDKKLDVWVIGPEDQDVKYSFQVLKITPASGSQINRPGWSERDGGPKAGQTVWRYASPRSWFKPRSMMRLERTRVVIRSRKFHAGVQWPVSVAR